MFCVSYELLASSPDHSQKNENINPPIVVRIFWGSFCSGSRGCRLFVELFFQYNTIDFGVTQTFFTKPYFRKESIVEYGCL